MTTARYGTRTIYGTDWLTYGPALPSGPDHLLTWVLLVDWDNDGIFDGLNEAGRIFHLEVFTGRQNFLKSSGGFQEVDVGEFSATLRNQDGRLDPYNTSSPLYGDVMPGRRFQLMVYDEVNAILQPIMKGRLDDIRPLYGLTDDVKITGSNGIKEMSAKQIRTEVYTAIRYDDALEILLADWEDGTDIDTTVSEAMPYWWASNRSQFYEANDIANAALGLFFIAEDGKATYKSKVSPDTALTSISGTDIDLDYGIRLPILWEVIKNKIRVYARSRIQQSNTELWRMSEVMFIPAGQSRTIWAQFSFNGEDGVAYSVTSPVATTDYTAFANADGTGTNYTGNMSITMTPFSTSAKLVVRNTGGTGFYVNLFKLRGVALVADKYTYSEEQDDASIAEFGEFPLEVKTDWLQDFNTANDHVAILLSRLASINRFPRVKLRAKPEIQFALRLFGLVSVNLPAKNVLGEFRIGYYKHSWTDELGQIVETEIYFEPNFLEDIAGAWVFPAEFGSTTIF